MDFVFKYYQSKSIHGNKVYLLSSFLNLRDCHANFLMDQRRNRQDRIRLTF